MEKYGVQLFNILAICTLSLIILSKASDEDRKVHIVYMGALPDDDYSPTSHHLSLLQSVVAVSFDSKFLIRSYKRSFNGFAANLTDQESQKLASLEGVVSVFPSKTYHTQTTRSWDFIGLVESSRRNPAVESDTIIGVVDSGIWPESESFSDKGFGPPPKKWKGKCNGGVNFTCNNKLIGARFYGKPSSGVLSARDDIGHGTHTASIAAGNVKMGTSYYGIAKGTARGGVPSARIAVYKVCRPECEADEIMASIDDAIADGVDVITISIGGSIRIPFYDDVFAIGSFHAMERGILVVNGAGNNGPKPGTVNSLAPWLMTVAASSVDRRITDKALLGNKASLIGNSVNPFTLNGTAFPLIHGSNASKNCSNSGFCGGGCLDPELVKGKIVVCGIIDGAKEAYKAGAIGSIVPSLYGDYVSEILPLPAAALSEKDFMAVKSYLNSTAHPTATILTSEANKDPTAPMTARFSSRGPNLLAKDIMKPDISAPGIEILAAFPPNLSPSGDYIMTGTSMACPHLAGAAAYVKTFHPDWSASAIKSSLMTTARVMKKTQDSHEEFDYGSGLVNPVRAVDPGLVYDAREEDYIKFLCSIGYTDKRVRLISGDKSSCPKEKGPARDLNYPSMTAYVAPEKAFTIRFSRRVRNVGFANSTYKATLSQNPRISVEVLPTVLSFKSLNEEKNFDVVVKGNLSLTNNISSVSLVWYDGTHRVRSPILLHCLFSNL